MIMDMAQVASESYEDAVAGLRSSIDEAARHAAAYTLSTYPDHGTLNDIATLCRRSLQTSCIMVNAIYNKSQITIGGAPRITKPISIAETDGLCLLAVGAGKPVAVNDLRRNHVADELIEATTWRSWASAPIFINGKAAGSVCALESAHTRVWTSTDQDMLVRAADQVEEAVVEWLAAS